MRKILITNDDGIYADGLIRLVKAAKKYGEICVVAPESQRSASSHSITLHSTLDVFPADFPDKDVKAFFCCGTPADCVRVGLRYIMAGKPDAVLSGINFGYNVATDLQYSGTAAAALEASFQGIPAIALSENASALHEVTDHYLDPILSRLLLMPAGDQKIWNVNFPGCPLSECRGVLYERTVSGGKIFDDHYIRQEKLENGGVRVLVRGVRDERAEEGTDLHAVNNNYVSVGKVNNIGF